VIIAIASSAGGLQPVEEFRAAATPADAVAAFCGEYTPPRDPADYLGEPTGWAAGAAQLGRSWAWDSAALDLVEVGYTSDLVGQLETHRIRRRRGSSFRARSPLRIHGASWRRSTIAGWSSIRSRYTPPISRARMI